MIRLALIFGLVCVFETAVADAVIPRDPDTVLVCPDGETCIPHAESNGQVCDASQGNATFDFAEIDLETRRAEARVNGTVAGRSASAEMFVTFDTQVRFPATITSSVTYSGSLRGGGGTRFGRARITARLVEIGDDGPVTIGTEHVLMNRNEDGSFGNTVTSPFNSASDVISGSLTPAVFQHELEPGTVYAIITRVEVESRGLNAFANLRTGDAGITVGCVTIDPDMIDSDEDGLFDSWETNGVDMGPDGVLDLASLGADPQKKDVFLEFDWTAGDEPTRIAIEAVKAAFAFAPVGNPDGSSGVRLWVDTGTLSDVAGLVGDDLGGGNEVDNSFSISGLTSSFYGTRSNNFDDNRRYVFRYGLSSAGPFTNTGTSTGGNTAATLNDTNQNWIDDEWSGRTVSITSGTGNGTVCNVGSNTDTVLTISSCVGLPVFATTPDASSVYAIIGPSDVTGQSSGDNTATTLIDEDASFSVDTFVGGSLMLTGRTGKGQVCPIVANTADTITISDCGNAGWITIPDDTSTYAVIIPTTTQGASTGGNSATTLNDTNQNWDTNAFVGQNVAIIAGTNVGDICQIRANTATQLTIITCTGAPTWSSTPDSTSAYRIGGTGGQASGPNFVDFVHDPATVMHELGHTLGLGHGGPEDSRNCKPNYLSVMNYHYQPGGIPVVPGAGFGIDWDSDGTFETIDFSPPRFGNNGRANAPLGTINEDGLNEGMAQDISDPAHQFIFVNGQNQLVGSNINNCVDWDGDGALEGTCSVPGPAPADAFVAPVNVNTGGGGPSACNGNPNARIEPNDTDEPLTGSNDWADLRYNFRLSNRFQAPLNAGSGEVTPTLEDYHRRRDLIRRTDLTLGTTFDPGFIAAGQDVILRLSVRNQGPNVATDVIITDPLAAEFTPTTLPPGCSVNGVNVLTCNIGQMNPMGEAIRDIGIHVAADLPCGDAQIMSIAHEATVANGNREDLNPADNTAADGLRVLCVRYEYPAKMVCGAQTDPRVMRLARGWYASSINIHNPNDEQVMLFSKLALTHPPDGRAPGNVAPVGFNELGYDEAFAVDCDDLLRDVFDGTLPAPNIEGYMVVQSPRSLDVTGLYSSATLDGDGTAYAQASTHTEQIRERERTPPPPARPPDPMGSIDLLPQNARCVPPEVGEGSIHRSALITVRNAGDSPAPTSTLGVTFSAGPPASSSIPGLAAGGTHLVTVDFPRICAPSCVARFIADAPDVIFETNEVNNGAVLECLPLPG